MSPNQKSPQEDYFNDFSKQPDTRDRTSQSPPEGNGGNPNEEGWQPRPKRIACVVCRKRKLRCDGNKPSCGTCARLGHDCAYDEVRRKSGPKRGYVKQLEARLAQVETLLKDQDPPTTKSGPSQTQSQNTFHQDGFGTSSSTMYGDVRGNAFSSAGPSISLPQDPIMPDASLAMGLDDDFSWEMIGLGLDEPLPQQDFIDELHSIYFEKIHPSIPIIHRPRYMAAMNLAPHMRPPICLRYAMWMLASSITPKFANMHEIFYARARKYAENDEMKGHGESMITVAHCQTWSLLGSYEFKMMYFPRAWMSVGRATRSAQMMGLHRQDGAGLDVKQCLPPAKDWVEREERRRTFWIAFCQDRYASIGTGWPMTIDEKDILTTLPSSEDAFMRSKPEKTLALSDVMSTEGASSLSPFAGVVLMACLFGRNLTHLHRPDADDNDTDLNGEFWKRHRALDNILLNTSLSLPTHLRLPAGLTDSNIVFCNMNIHTSVICLHQAAIFKADKNRMPPNISAESKRRCIIAADQITNIMKMISHIDLSSMNPFIAFCLYVAARVFVQYLKSRPQDQTVKSSLKFLLSAMQALKARNPLTESFLVQLDVDLEGTGLEIPSNNTKWRDFSRAMGEVPVNTDAVSCSPLIHIRQTQGLTVESNNDPPLQTTDGIPLDFSQIDSQAGFSPGGSLPDRRKSTQPLSHPCTRTVSIRGLVPDDFAGNLGEGGDLNTMDLSPDGSGSNSDHHHHSASDHPTPSTSASNKAPSSHTSYTPPHFDDASHQQSSNYSSNSANMSPSAFFNPGNVNSYGMSPNTAAQFFPFTSASPKQPGQTINVGATENPFSFPHSWEHGGGAGPQGPTGMTPGATTGLTPGATTGMSPMGDGQWTQMLEGMNWNGWPSGHPGH